LSFFRGFALFSMIQVWRVSFFPYYNWITMHFRVGLPGFNGCIITNDLPTSLAYREGKSIRSVSYHRNTKFAVKCLQCVTVQYLSTYEQSCKK